jgi:hypothetical protein
MMRKTLAAIQVFTGGLCLLLGLLFLIGSAGTARRLVVAAIFLLAGGVLAGLGARAWRRADQLLPERLEAVILDAAKREDGEIAADELTAALGWKAPHAQSVLEDLLARGVCRRSQRGGELFYLFTGLQTRLTLLVCEYCGAEYPLSSGTETCPACGGPVSRTVVTRTLSDGSSFSMDTKTGETNASD